LSGFSRVTQAKNLLRQPRGDKWKWQMDFSDWIKFEAERIIRMGSLTSEEHRADYMRVQIEAALRKAFAHGRDGLTETDPPRAFIK
jgi:hypothetical protein